MTNVWRIGQEVKANDIYENAKKGKITYVDGEGDNTEVKTSKLSFFGGEIFAAENLTYMCNEMSKNFEEIVDEQNQCIKEIEISYDQLSDMQYDLQNEVNKLKAEIEELLKKEEDGTITEEERTELERKTGELNTLQAGGSSKIKSKNDEIADKINKSGAEARSSKAKIATDYAETAMEKGQPLAETKDLRKSFWRKTFGGWNKEPERKAGKELVEAGNNLAQRVNFSAELDQNIKRQSKKLV